MDKHEFGRKIDNIVLDGYDKVFEWADDHRGDLKPSEVMSILDGRWGLGDQWADWWGDSDSHYGEQEWS